MGSSDRRIQGRCNGKRKFRGNQFTAGSKRSMIRIQATYMSPVQKLIILYFLMKQITLENMMKN